MVEKCTQSLPGGECYNRFLRGSKWLLKDVIICFKNLETPPAPSCLLVAVVVVVVVFVFVCVCVCVCVCVFWGGVFNVLPCANGSGLQTLEHLKGHSL